MLSLDNLLFDLFVSSLKEKNVMKLLYTTVISMVIFGGWFNLVSAENVEFPDLNLANKVRETLNLPADADIPKAQLATLTVLDASLPDDASVEEEDTRPHRFRIRDPTDNVRTLE